MSAKKKIKNELEKPISKKIERNQTVVDKLNNWFTKHYKSLGLFTIGIIVGLLIMFVIGYGNIAKLDNGKELVASIDGLDITANDLYDDLRDTYGVSKIITNIDDYILLDKYGDKKADAESYADNYIKQLKSSYSDGWEDFLSYYGFKDDAALKESLISEYYVNLVTANYIKDKITDGEIEKYYKDKVAGDIKVSHILIEADYDEGASDEEIAAAKEKAKAKAAALIKQLDASADPEKLFATLAKENSADSSNAADGGALDYFNKGDMEAAFETAAYALDKVGEYTKEPVETTYGYHIIIKTAKTKAKEPLKDIKDEIIEKIVAEKTAADTSLPIKAMMAIREKYNLVFEEETMKAAYNKLMADNIAKAKEDKETTES